MPPNAVTYNIFISQAGRRGDLDEVRRVMGEMTSRNVEPDDMTYHGLLSAYEARGDVAGAKGEMEEMKAKGIKPSHKYTHQSPPTPPPPPLLFPPLSYLHFPPTISKHRLFFATILSVIFGSVHFLV
jgi:pentatricopeptide repeat protein